MSTTRWERVMTQEQLMKVKIKYLEDRITTMEKSIERLHKIVGTRDRYKHDQGQGFKDIDTSDIFRDADTMENDHELI
jgi:hypothetical protein